MSSIGRDLRRARRDADLTRTPDDRLRLALADRVATLPVEARRLWVRLRAGG